jgi:hypothetical protein
MPEGALTTRRRALPLLPNGLRGVPGRPSTVVLSIALIAAVGVLAAAGLSVRGGLQQGMLIAAMAVAGSIPLVIARYRGRLELFEAGIAIALVYLVLFPLRATVVLVGWDYSANAGVLTASDAVIRSSLITGTWALLATSIGIILPWAAKLGARVSIPRVAAAEKPSAVTAMGLFIVGLSAEGLILAASKDPGLPLIGGRGSGLVSSLSVLMLVGLSLLSRRAALTRNRGDIAAMLAATAAGAVVGILVQFKEVVLLSLLTPVVMVNFARPRGVRTRWVVGVVVAGVFVVFPLVTVWRQVSTAVGSQSPLTVGPRVPGQFLHHDLLSGRPRSFSISDVLTDPLAVTSARLYGFDSLTLVVRYTPSVIPYRDGATLEQLAAGLVPRVLWPGKPNIGIGYWFAVHYWGTPPGTKQVPQTVTHPGELYIDFGLIGVIVGCFLLGMWYRFAYCALRPRESGTAALLYSVLLLTIMSVDRDLPLVYVTLVQRLVATAFVLGALSFIQRARARIA